VDNAAPLRVDAADMPRDAEDNKDDASALLCAKNPTFCSAHG
jgi:hypothetical protein